MNEVPLSAQVDCVRREIRMRERVYPRRVSEGKMSINQAREELAAMQAVLETVEAAAAKDRLL